VKHVVSFHGQLFRLAAVSRGEFAQEMIGQERDVFTPVAQRRHEEGDER